ncbi:MAG: hypothetical protein IJ268_01900 [Proteobacteria bacterium]|nr:hypothetical protein [Pseudomonadota bacterium]
MIITLILVLLGIYFQFFCTTDPDILSILIPISAALIAFSPTLALPKRTRLKDDDKTGVFLNKWHTIPTEDIQNIFDRINSETFGKIELSKSGKLFSNFTGVISIIITVIICVILYMMDYYYACAIIFDIILIPRTLFYIIYGCSPEEAKDGTQAYNLSSKTETILHLLKDQENLHHYHPEVQLDLTKQGSATDIRDVRCNLVPQSEIPDFLCAQFSITQNQVNDSTFSYAYFVIVFKGEKMAQKKKKHAQNEISQILHEKAPNFSLEVNKSDGNSIFVMTKKRGSRPYHTDDNDCMRLSLAADEILGYLESDRFHRFAAN